MIQDQEIKVYPQLFPFFFPQLHNSTDSTSVMHSEKNLHRLWLGRGIHCHQSICKENRHHKFSLVIVTLVQLMLF